MLGKWGVGRVGESRSGGHDHIWPSQTEDRVFFNFGILEWSLKIHTVLIFKRRQEEPGDSQCEC